MVIVAETIAPAMTILNGMAPLVIYLFVMVHVYMVIVLDPITARASIILNGLDHNATYLSVM
jgi:Ni,Fe-hydrogenase I cytochrome b subunit